MPETTAQNFLQRIEKSKPILAIVLEGTDPYLRDQCRNALIAKYIPEGARDWAVFKISATGGGLQETLERAQIAPMLSSHQVLILEDADALERGSDETVERATNALAAYLKDPAPFSTLLIEAEQFDRRKKLFKTLFAAALIVELTIGSTDITALTIQMARELGTEIAPDAASALVDAVNGEPAKIRLELEKLQLYAAGRRIASSDVDVLVVAARKSTVWKLAEVFAAGDRRASMEFLDCLLREGEQPAGIVGALSWMYRKLIEARELPPGANQYQAARDLGMRPESAAIAIAQAHKIPRERLLAGIPILADADSTLKSGAPNPRATLEFVMARLTASGRGAAA